MKEKNLTSPEVNQLMAYISQIKENGAFDIFSQLFQTDFRILVELYYKKDCHPSYLADTLHVTRSNIAANLRILQQKGYIYREVDDKNHREIHVHITKVGEEYVVLINSQLSFLLEGWLKILGPEETQHLFTILKLSSDPKIITDNLKHFDFGSK